MGGVSALEENMATRPIQKVLIANRGEIARRIMRTCRAMGIAPAAVFSDVDVGMPFVREADEAVCIGPAPSAESYLRIDKILEAAERTGADAVHPGYGFLSENAAFADACANAGLIFIGPTADAIAAMGSKREAKALVGKAGVPVIAGYNGSNQDEAVLKEEALKIGFPVLLKASGGGGGKGMKLVRKESELADAIASARREAESSFGDATLLVEQYIENSRHIEIQVLGDAHGNMIHLNERECSIQRRHQKIIEESPSTALDSKLRAEMGKSAVQCAQTIGYQNAGTVEFIFGPNQKFYFLEMNTRLQVEHPITECVTGLDLVEEQIHIAQGEPLRLTQEDVRLEGSAIEVRLYAEDPTKEFLPQSGKVVDWHIPDTPGLRVDSGVETGSEIGIYYDPMLAKVITHGPSRNEAIQRMRRALTTMSVQGVDTNQEFLLQVLAEDAFVAGDINTHFIDHHMQPALSRPPVEDNERCAALIATLATQQQREAERTIVPRVPSGWRNNYHTPQWVEYVVGDREYRIEYRCLGGRSFEIFQEQGNVTAQVLACQPPRITLKQDDVRFEARVTTDGSRHYVHCNGVSVVLAEKSRFPDPSLSVPEGGCIAPMPGKIIELRVAEGDGVEQGQVLLIMEAMKMEYSVTAPKDGVVKQILVTEDEQVDGDVLLVVLS